MGRRQRQRRRAAKPTTSEGKREVMVVRVRCRFCETMNGPMPLDGKPYICSSCRNSLFAYHGPTLKELKAGLRLDESNASLMLAQMECLARGDIEGAQRAGLQLDERGGDRA